MEVKGGRMNRGKGRCGITQLIDLAFGVSVFKTYCCNSPYD